MKRHWRKTAERERLNNLRFVGYDGKSFPFGNGTFDMVVTRYALHHFPDINKSFREINRVLKKGGFLFLSDPAPNENDTQRFVDEYMRLKNDGHIKFYTKNEWRSIGEENGLMYSDGFETSIRFPRKRETAHGFDELMSRFDSDVINGYDLEVTADEIWVTERVNNLLFVNL